MTTKGKAIQVLDMLITFWIDNHQSDSDENIKIQENVGEAEKYINNNLQ